MYIIIREGTRVFSIAVPRLFKSLEAAKLVAVRMWNKDQAEYRIAYIGDADEWRRI